MKATFLFLVGLLLGACCQASAIPPTEAQAPAVAPVSALVAKTVALVHDGEAFRPYCSGVWVGNQTILTAHHCIEDEEGEIRYAVPADVEGAKPLSHPASLWKRDQGHDLALLQVVGRWPNHDTARPRTAPIDQGMPVRAVGHSVGLLWSFSAGHVAAVRQIDLDPEILYVQTTAPTSRGNSGCGLWDDAGDLVGIAHAGIPSGQNLNFYVAAQYVADLLRGGVL